MTSTFDENAILSVAGHDDDEVAARFAGTRRRLPQLLPPRCVREIEGFGATHPEQLRTREQLVWSEAAITALCQSSRALCERQDELHRLHSSFVREALRHEKNMRVGSLGSGSWPAHGEVFALLSSLAWARLQGHRSVLLAQLEREADLRNGRPISAGVKLPDGGDGGDGGGAELELVPLDPSPAGSGGGGEAGGDGGAAPVAVVALPPADVVDPDADAVDDGDGDGLDFLDRRP